jgi:hypothetical protein
MERGLLSWGGGDGCPRSRRGRGHWTLATVTRRWGQVFTGTTPEFNAAGDKKPKAAQGGYDEMATKAYVEYGLIPRLNLISSVVHKTVSYTDDYSHLTNSGFQDGTLALKWRFLEAPVVFSGIVGTRFPLGYSTQRDPELGGRGLEPRGAAFCGENIHAHA